MCYLIPQACSPSVSSSLPFLSILLSLTLPSLSPFTLPLYLFLPSYSLPPLSYLLLPPSSLVPLSSSSPPAIPGLLLTVLSDRIEYAQLTEGSIKQSSLLEDLPILVNTSADPVTGMCVICVGECPPSGGSRGGSVGSMEPPF